jgi:hypothetical protein
MAQRTIGDYESQEAARAQAVGALVEEREKMVLMLVCICVLNLLAVQVQTYKY